MNTIETGATEKRDNCIRILKKIKKKLMAKEKKLDEFDPDKKWMSRLIDEIGWLISALPENGNSYQIVNSDDDLNFECAAYRFTEIVEGDEARFMIRRCYPSSDFSVQEYVILIDTTPDRDYDIFETLRAFGDDL